MTFWKWSRTAETNSAADGTINWAEGQAPSTVNNSARAMMAAAAKFRDDISGAIVTGGSSTAYTVTSFQVFDSLANMNGAMIAFTPHTTNAAGPVTLNVDGLGAKALRFSPSGVELPAGALVQGTPYVATYYNATTEWILQGLAGNPYNIPLGGMLEFTGATAPNASFVFPNGQAISRTTYAAYFALVSTTYGVGDGSSTFNVIDKRGRVSAGFDTDAATGRLTAGLSGINSANLGAAGGAETHTLITAETPTHNHGVTDNHSHNTPVNFFTSVQGGTGAGGVLTVSGGSGSTSLPSGVTAAGSISTQNTGSGGAHRNVQPTIVVNYILRVL